ncbi:unnamed protein product [Rotaria sp. Silwood2]|nr:unnamed protein product [Rotaria sp. Silwood2]CAF4322054.1 unnamed protein product [Rotaria sp. Silwood2]
MAVVPSISQSLYSIFPSQHRDKVMEVYNRIPGTLVQFLKEQDVVQVINFEDTLNIQGNLGTEKNKNWDTFRMDLRSSIAGKLTYHKIKGIKPEELSDSISNEYLKKCPNWAKRDENLSAIVELNKTFSDRNHRYVNAYIYARITEECEDNFFYTNMYKYSYYVSMDLKGIVIDEKRALELGELVSRGVPEAITIIEQNCQLTWGGFLKKILS